MTGGSRGGRRQRHGPVWAALLVALGLTTAAAQKVVGRWHTRAATALAEAREKGRPVLAVAMDHG